MPPWWERLGSVGSVFVRFAVGLSFFSAVADRFGWWGAPGQPNVAWGEFDKFVEYTGKLNWFLPHAMIPTLAIIATCAEIVPPAEDERYPANVRIRRLRHPGRWAPAQYPHGREALAPEGSGSPLDCQSTRRRSMRWVAARGAQGPALCASLQRQRGSYLRPGSSDRGRIAECGRSQLCPISARGRVPNAWPSLSETVRSLHRATDAAAIFQGGRSRCAAHEDV